MPFQFAANCKVSRSSNWC